MKRRDMQAAIQHMAVHVNKNLDTPSAGINAFVGYFFDSLDVETSSFSDFVKATQARLLASLAVDRFSDSAAPSKITHRVWLTEPDSPASPPQAALDQIESDTLNITPDYMNIFWVNSPRLRAELEARFAANKTPLICADISAFSSDPLFDSLQTLVASRKFVLASDFLRIILLRKMGGVYSDLGVSYNRQFIEIVEASEYTFFLGDGLFFQTSLLAAPPNSNLITLFHALMTKPEIMPRSWVTNSDTMMAAHEVNVFAGPAFSAICYLFADPLSRIFVCTRDGQNVHWQSSGSWYGSETKYGNAHVPTSGLSIVDPAKFDTYREISKSEVKAFNLSIKSEAKIRLLCGLSDYFSNEPTRLCRIMYFQGSDKALSWHNYTHVYNYLLPQYRERTDSLLEIGIGTNNLDVESSMGVTGVPGASLRGWREFFDLADVHGADIDRRILFSEPGIHTHYVDQLSREDIGSLWDNMSSTGPVTIVIDDGLHTFDANTNVYEETVTRNADMKVFIVEDILTGYVQNWEAYLEQKALRSAIVALPNKNNKSDNILVLIFGENCE